MGKNIFNSIKLPSVKTNRFDLSHDVKFSMRMGRLTPTAVLECLPGDSFNISVQNMLRFAPLISPVMHKVKVTTHWFFVPHRILWDLWDRWISDDSDADLPYVLVPEATDIEVGSLADYLGIPTGVVNQDIKVSVFQIAAYLKIYDEYYRAQFVQDPKFIDIVPGNNVAFLDYFTKADGAPLQRGWNHDYFTSALPFAQAGDAVQIPLTTADDQVVEWRSTDGLDGNGTSGWRKEDGFPPTTGPIVNASGPTPYASSINVGSPASDHVTYDPRGSLVVDVQSDATDINSLRRAFKLQEWLERLARGGKRYKETIMSMFGVNSSDARLQRPEYIGGAYQNMVISEVLATAQNDTDTIPVGQMAGHGISVGGGNTFRYRCEEHGTIIGIISVMPVTAYMQGLERQFTRFDRLDFAWPLFANIGEQEVKQKEIYLQSNTPEATFGYVPRYAEYKFLNSRVAGEMRTTLDFWHLARKFSTDPALNAAFIAADPSTRIFAVTDPDEDHIFAHTFNNISAVRKLPRYGIPQI